MLSILIHFQGTDGFGFPMLQDIYTLMLPAEERHKSKNNQINILP